MASSIRSSRRCRWPRWRRCSVPPRTDAPGVVVAALMRELTDTLRAGGIAESSREASDIVAALHDAPRFWPATHCEARVGDALASAARAAAQARVRGAPFAYAVGRAAFRHLTLLVDERVLIPRAETEE